MSTFRYHNITCLYKYLRYFLVSIFHQRPAMIYASSRIRDSLKTTMLWKPSSVLPKSSFQYWIFPQTSFFPGNMLELWELLIINDCFHRMAFAWILLQIIDCSFFYWLNINHLDYIFSLLLITFLRSRLLSQSGESKKFLYQNEAL